MLFLKTKRSYVIQAFFDFWTALLERNKSCLIFTFFPNFQVAWVRVDTQTILTIHQNVITRNPRITLAHSDHRSWFLQVSKKLTLIKFSTYYPQYIFVLSDCIACLQSVQPVAALR